MNQNVIIIVLVLVLAMVIFFITKNRKKNKNQKNDLSSRSIDNNHQKKDEVWKTIKEFLKQENLKGLEIISTYSIRRPNIKDLHKRLKQAAIYEAKKKAKVSKTKYVAPVIPQKFALETYFQNLHEETLAISKQNVSNVNKFDEKNNLTAKYKPHRINFIKEKKDKKSVFTFIKKISIPFIKSKKNNNKIPTNLKEREQYVLIFRTKNSRTKEINLPRAIEVEIIKNPSGNKNTERKIFINKELELEKEMAWIKPIKEIDDKRAIAEEQKMQKNLEKQRINEIKYQNNELFYQKFLPIKTLKKVSTSLKKLKILKKLKK